MASSLFQIRVDDSLKDEASRVFENLGIDTSTAVRMFLKRSVMENGIPFSMTLPRKPYNADRGYRAMIEIGEATEKNGLSDMPLDEINAGFRMYRASTSIVLTPRWEARTRERLGLFLLYLPFWRGAAVERDGNVVYRRHFRD